MRARRKVGKLSRSREKRDEFLTTPRSCSSRGEPKAKLLGGFSFGTYSLDRTKKSTFVLKAFLDSGLRDCVAIGSLTIATQSLRRNDEWKNVDYFKHSCTRVSIAGNLL